MQICTVVDLSRVCEDPLEAQVKLFAFSDLTPSSYDSNFPLSYSKNEAYFPFVQKMEV